MYVLAAANAVLLLYAWSNFALTQPEYFTDAWPTFSRALTLDTRQQFGLLAGVAGAGLFCGALAIAVMRWDQARTLQKGKSAGIIWAIAVAAAAPLGIVHYFHVVVRLHEDNDLHMLLSYTFFFGMTFVIVADMWCRHRLTASARKGRPPAPDVSAVHINTGHGVAVSAIVFLTAFLLKDAAWNPWQAPAQKLFVAAEFAWVILTHAYAVLYVPKVRAWFKYRRHPGALATGAYGSNLARLVVVGAMFTIAMPPPDAQAPAPATGIGATGRIQPMTGVIALVAPPGRVVERVTVRQGERVRKGTVLVVMADHAARALERDYAADRLRDVEQQFAARSKVADLDVEAARLTVAQAREDNEAVSALDQRTVAAREKRQRANAFALAETNLKLAEARREDTRQSFTAEQKSLRMRLNLARVELASMQLVAPVDATVLELTVQNGASAGGGPAVTLADTSRMYVVADFFEGDLPKLAQGQRATVTNAALGQTLHARVERIGGVVDSVNRLTKVWLVLDQTAPADRFIGMQVDVKVDPAGIMPAKGSRP
jgi:HlyD family secretion protein